MIGRRDFIYLFILWRRRMEFRSLLRRCRLYIFQAIDWFTLGEMAHRLSLCNWRRAEKESVGDPMGKVFWLDEQKRTLQVMRSACSNARPKSHFQFLNFENFFRLRGCFVALACQVRQSPLSLPLSQPCVSQSQVD